MKQIFEWLREQFKEDIQWYETHGINKDFNRGIIGEANKGISLVDEAEAKWESDCCKWKPTTYSMLDGKMYGYKTDCGNGHICGKYKTIISHYKYCHYCGKPIKISEVE